MAKKAPTKVAKKAPAKKAAAKKAPAKKAAGKKAAVKKAAAQEDSAARKIHIPPPVPVTGADFLPQEGFAVRGDASMAYLQRLMQHRSNPRKNRSSTDFLTAADIRKRMVSPSHFFTRYLLGAAGWAMGSSILLVGQEQVGKTTLAFNILGDVMRAGGTGMVLYRPQTVPSIERLKRALHPSPAMAERFAQSILMMPCHSQRQFEEHTMDFLQVIRGRVKLKEAPLRPLPMNIPVVIVSDLVDSFLTDEEANGFLDWANFMDEKAVKKFNSVGEGSNMTSAKWFAGWSRRQEVLSETYNVIFVYTLHQKAKIDFNASKSPIQLPQYYLEARNNTTRGGRSLTQHGTVVVILVNTGKQALNAAKQPTGDIILARVYKNSGGVKNREIRWELRNEHQGDTPHMLEPCIVLDDSFAEFMAKHSYMGTTVSNGLYTCPHLNVYGVPAADFSRAFHATPDAATFMGKQLKLEGYYDPVSDSKDWAVGGEVADGDPVPELPPMPETYGGGEEDIELQSE